jgi:hypothetical protein
MSRIGGLEPVWRSLDVDWAEPIGNIRTDSKPAWVKIDPELVNFPKQAMDWTLPLLKNAGTPCQ